MAWQDETVPILRVMLNDMGCGELTYTDSRLIELLLAAAYLNVAFIPFPTTYTVTISTETISPDPSTDAPFLSFMTLKAACLADTNTFRSKAFAAGIEARCGPATLRTGQHLQGFQTLLEEGPCKAFEELRDEFIFNGNTKAIRAVLSPFVGNQFDPSISLGRNNR